MALIKCPECNKEVSDRASSCPYCGYPINDYQTKENNVVCKIENIPYNLERALKFSNEGKYKDSFLEISKLTNLSIHNCLNILNYIKITNEIPKDYVIKIYSKEEEKDAATKIFSMKDDKTKIAASKACPKCGCTDFTPLRRKFSLLAGFATNKVDMICNKCGTIIK